MLESLVYSWMPSRARTLTKAESIRTSDPLHLGVLEMSIAAEASLSMGLDFEISLVYTISTSALFHRAPLHVSRPDGSVAFRSYPLRDWNCPRCPLEPTPFALLPTAPGSNAARMALRRTRPPGCTFSRPRHYPPLPLADQERRTVG
jgi:hypothetical protein